MQYYTWPAIWRDLSKNETRANLSKSRSSNQANHPEDTNTHYKALGESYDSSLEKIIN